MKVAIVAASPRWIGGQGVQADLLVRFWGNDPDVATHFIPIDPLMPRPLRWVERIPGLRTLVRTPFYLAALWRGINDVDIVHIFSASYSSFLLAPAPALLIARMRGKKTLVHYHSGEGPDHLRRSAFARMLLRHVNSVVVPSLYLVNAFREFGFPIQAIPNVVDAAQFRYRARQPLRKRLVCTRGFHKYYGVDVVVRAFARVKRVYPESQLCLVGKGPCEKQIRNLVESLGLLDVTFAGAVSHPDVGRFYEENDIFINASWLDNMPVSVLEAFASGTPVVTTAPEGIRYIVEHGRTGLLSAPGDWRGLAENVIRLLANPRLTRQLTSNAYQQSQHYQWVEVRTQWLAIYRSLNARCRVPSSAEPAFEQRLQRVSTK